MHLKTAIGLEVHIKLNTSKKIFSNTCSLYNAVPNIQISAIDLGFPGTMPRVNKYIIKMAILFAISINSNIASIVKFDRKNYFYPDLPKGYQITQTGYPIALNGYLNIISENGIIKKIGIIRSNLEEDSGKLFHEKNKYTGIDFNRSGIPLLEVVSKPEICSSFDAIAFLQSLHLLVKNLKICDGNMQEGSFRCDVNISVCHINSFLGTRVEIKNLNSFKYIKKAIKYEIKRQMILLKNNLQVIQETRLYVARQDITIAMRNKSSIGMYKYFEEPDLPCFKIDLHDIRNTILYMPEIYIYKKKRLIDQYAISEYNTDILIYNKHLLFYYEKTMIYSINNIYVGQLLIKWILGYFLYRFKICKVLNINRYLSPKYFMRFIYLIFNNMISDNNYKPVFDSIIYKKSYSSNLILTYTKIPSEHYSNIKVLILHIINKNKEKLSNYKLKKKKIFNFLLPKVLKINKNNISIKILIRLLNSLLYKIGL